MIAPETINALAQGSAERILDSLLEGTALALFAWMLLRVWPRPNAATRFAVWFSVLIATAVLPFLSGWSAASTVPAKSLISVPAAWAQYFAAAWLTLASLALGRVLFGYQHLRRMRRGCQEVDSRQLDVEIVRCLQRNDLGRKVRLLASATVTVPTAVGFLRPAVILPERLLRELATNDLRQVLLHEIAHLRRWDDWTNALQQVVKALLCFHPAMWWVEQRISLEREMACDDAVLAETSSPRAYAECLARLAENSALRRGVSLAQAAVSRVRQLTLRVASILDDQRPTAAAPKKWAVSLVGSFAVACAVVAWHTPRVLSFVQPRSPMTAHARAADAAFNFQQQVAPATAAHYAPRSKQPQVIQAQADGSSIAATTKLLWDGPARPQAVRTKITKAKRATPKPPVLQAKANTVVHAPLAPSKGVAQAVVTVYYVETRDTATGATLRLCVWQWTVTQAQEQVRKSI